MKRRSTKTHENNTNNGSVGLLSGGRTLELLKLVDVELEPLLAHGERGVLPTATNEMWAEQPEESRRAVLPFWLSIHSEKLKVRSEN